MQTNALAIPLNTSPVRFSPSATARVCTLLNEEPPTENGQASMLRMFVSGGGCSGFQYGFTFESEISADDAILKHEGFDMLIDNMSYVYLSGVSVDYVEGFEGARFVIENPNATSTCGCGNSFAL